MTASQRNKYWYLKEHKFFKAITRTQYKELDVISRYKEFKKDEILYLSEEENKRVFYLKEGTLKVIETNETGDENLKEILYQGDLFGELGLTDDYPKNELVKAVSNKAIICSFLIKDFEKLIVENPDLGLSIFKLMGLKVKSINSKYTDLFGKSVNERLKNFLLKWACKEGVTKGNEVRLTNYLTQKDISQLICASRQTTTQLFKSLENDGILVYDRKEIIITDIMKLKESLANVV